MACSKKRIFHVTVEDNVLSRVGIGNSHRNTAFKIDVKQHKLFYNTILVLFLWGPPYMSR